MLDPTTPPITITSTLVLTVWDVDDLGWNFNFGRVPLVSGITDGITPLLQLVGTAKHMVFRDLVIYGGAFSTPGCGDGLQILPQDGGAFYECKFADISISWCGGDGIMAVGNVFETEFDGLDCKNNLGSGIVFNNSTQWVNSGSTPVFGGVVSNCMAIAPNLSRNNGYGLRCIGGATSVDIDEGSFVNNGQGGCEGEIRSATDVNGENTGPALFDFSASGIGYVATLVGCNLTSDGATLGYGGTAPSVQLVKYAPGVGDGHLVVTDCYVTAEGNPPPTNLILVGP